MKFDLYQYLLLFTAIAASSSILTPFFRAIARKANIFDHPGGRKLQESPVAYLGGLAVATPITLGSLIIVFIPSLSEIKFQVYLGLIIPSIIIALIGLFDDIYQLPPLPRFIAQSGVGFITSVMLYLTDSGVKLFDKSWLNYLVTTLWVVTIINALNFMDNMDGLATCLSIMISMSMFALSYLNEQYVVSALCVAIFAACIGFLFWNKKPATIYLGDAGALYLGFLLAAISIRIDIQSQSEIIRVLVPLLIFAIPVIDIVQVVIRRIVKGSSPFDGGRDHLSHLLLTKGLSEGKVLTVLITSAAVLSFFGIFLSEVI
jgi:UDP-GlcNAc:undecaprenyl-phosphate GlcNAc-1-phosphate transferase